MPFTPNLLEAFAPATATRLAGQLSLWSRQWRTPTLARDIPIHLNPRLRTAVARYRKDRETIEVGPRFLALRARKAEVLAHELAHAAVQRLYGKEARTHGEEWRALVRAAGFVPRVHLDAAGKASAKSTQTKRSAGGLFEHRCPVCQMVRLARRPVSRWRCSRCTEDGLTGILTITRLPTKP